MKTIVCILLSAAMATAAAGQTGDDVDAGPSAAATTQPADPAVGEREQPNAGVPTTQPRELLDATAIYERLVHNGDYVPAVTAVPHGQADWARGVIRATGQGHAEGPSPRQRMMAQRAARVAAARNALLAADGLELDGRRVRGLPAGPGGEAAVPARIETGQVQVRGEVRDFAVVDTRFDPATRTAEVTIEAPLHGVEGLVRIGGRVPADPTAEPSPRGAAGPDNGPGARPDTRPADLILIDARGAAFTPALAPRLLDEQGRVVYDPAAEERPADQHAFVHVIYTGRDPALPHGRFENAIVLVAVRTEGGSLVLSPNDVDALNRRPDARELLRAGQAVIVLSPPPKPLADQ